MSDDIENYLKKLNKEVTRRSNEEIYSMIEDLCKEMDSIVGEFKDVTKVINYEGWRYFCDISNALLWVLDDENIVYEIDTVEELNEEWEEELENKEERNVKLRELGYEEKVFKYPHDVLAVFAWVRDEIDTESFKMELYQTLSELMSKRKT